jgi:adenylate cyclase
MMVPYVRGDREATAELIPHFQRLLDRADDPVAHITGRVVLGQIAFWSGEFMAAREHLEIGTRLYHTEEFQRFAREYGWDGGLFAHAYLMTSLFNLGYPDHAAVAHRELTTLAEATRSPYSILIARGFGATLLYDRGETEPLLELCDGIIAFAMEQKLYPWVAGGMCGRGAALLARGAVDEAVAQIQQGLGLYLGMGLGCSHCYYLTYLAGAQRAAGNTADALATIEEGLSLCATLFARFHESEFLRLKGEILAEKREIVEAENALRRAMAVAREREARSLELRAATSLGALLAAQARRDEARSVLAPVYEWFTEGFETADLRRAQTTLAALG